MPHSRGDMSRAIDREIYQIVRKIIDEADVPGRLTVSTIYQRIQKSNSSLRRRPKLVLEDSIERILASIADAESSSDSEAALEAAAPAADDASDAMNRHMRKSLAPSRPAPEREGSPPRGGTPATQSAGAQKRTRPTSPTSNAPAPSKKARKPKDAVNTDPPTHVSLADLGGMDDVITFFKDNLVLPLQWPELYIDRGLKTPRGILLHGPPGCGKTMLAEATAAALGLPFLSISAPSIVSGMSGESEKQLRQHFEHAISLAPCLMFIDEIDTITPKRESAQREMERRIVGQLLTCMDDLALDKTGGKPVVVLAATNRPDSLDPALRRAGRFDSEIRIRIPNVTTREQILKAQTRKIVVAEDVDFAQLASMTAGFVGADLESLVSTAGSMSMARFREALENMPLPNGPVDLPLTFGAIDAAAMEVDVEIDRTQPCAAAEAFLRLNSLARTRVMPPSVPATKITMADFLSALPTIQPSAKREGFTTIPDTTWASIGALSSVRKQLVSAIVNPIAFPERYARFNVSVPSGILLYGPPGCGKTLLAKAVANEARANFIAVKGPELLNKFVGESEKAIRQMFTRANASAPCIIFFDEIDALVPTRDAGHSEASTRVVAQLLTELDGINSRAGIFIIAATNRPEMIDPAMLRPGRFGKHLFVGLPSDEGRVEIIKTQLKNVAVADLREMEAFARDRCAGFSGADLHNLVIEAAQIAVERMADALELRDLEGARPGVNASVAEQAKFEMIERVGLAAFRS